MDRVDPRVRGDGLRADAFDAVVDEQLGVGQAREVAAHQARELGVDFADAGDQPQPDLVAQVFGRPVRRILPEGDAVLDGVFENFLARREQQRADHLSDLCRDSRQPPQPGSAQQVDEKGFDRVVGMVGDGDGRVAVLAAQGVEPCVAQPPGRHLHRLARALHFGPGLEAPVVERRAVLFGLVFHQHFVLVALCAAQLEVAVGHAHPVAAAGEQREHDHRVHAARDGEQDFVVVRGEVVLVDVALKRVQKIHNMFTSVSISMPNFSRTFACTVRAKAITSPPVAPPWFTSTSACRS